MQIIKGKNKSKFINDYCDKNKEISFLLIDVSNNSYPFECKNLMLLQTNRKNLIKDLKAYNHELEQNVEFFLFTNDKHTLSIIEHYKELLKEFNRKIFLVLNDNSEAELIQI